MVASLCNSRCTAAEANRKRSCGQVWDPKPPEKKLLIPDCYLTEVWGAQYRGGGFVPKKNTVVGCFFCFTAYHGLEGLPIDPISVSVNECLSQ